MDIGSALKQQMLAVLIDALGKPTANIASDGKPPVGVASDGKVPVGGAADTKPPQSFASDRPPPSGRTAAGAASPPALGLTAGETVRATVMAIEPDGALLVAFERGSARAELAGSTLPEAARRVGATLALRVETAGPTPRLAFVAVAASDPSVAPATRPAPAFRPAPALPGGLPATATTAAHADLERAAPLAAAPATAAVVARAAVDAASRQASAAPLYADLAALSARSESPFPRPVATLAAALLASRVDGDRPVTPESVKLAFERSGVLLEAVLARGEPPARDAKSLLTALRDLLRDDAMRSTPAAPDLEPPRRDGGIAAQRPVLSQLASETDPKTIAATLGREAEQALERIKLHQIASLPEVRPGPHETQRPQQLSMDIPIVIAQQTAIAGFRIEREKRPPKGDAAAPTDVWGVRFAIDADAFGPVQAHVRLAGHAVSVSLWAEDPRTHGAFIAAMPSLEAALSANGLEIGEIAVFQGKPVEPKRAERSRFLDRRS